jgi:pimeloyl-ACP methyl ester carboxylesterase
MGDAPSERRIEANGLGFRALVWDGGPPPVLLLHATSFCADAWRPVWEAARAAGGVGAGLAAAAVDQRGHGGSDAPDGRAAYAWTALAADVLALAEALCAASGAARAVLVGHSSGATACLAAAGLRPDRVAALVAIEPVLFERPPPGADADSFGGSGALAAAARRRRATFADLDEARARLRPRFPYAGFAEEAFEAVLAGGLAPDGAGRLALRCPGEREAACYEGAAALDVWPLAARIEAPLLLVEGSRGAVPERLGARLLAGGSRARRETLAGGTHFVALEQPRAVGHAIGCFLAETAIGVGSWAPPA